MIECSVSMDITNNGGAFFNRTSFPEGFTFGASSSAYQFEGAANEGGKGPSIWDAFTHKYPEKIRDRSNGDVATDQYHRYKEDVALMKDMNLNSYRFSISWSRILPKGKLSGGINKEGIDYYNNFINELLDNGIEPFVTIFHWDLPLSLEEEYGGFLNPKIIKDFVDYAELCFREFGDRVKHWTTINEPWTYSLYGYGEGVIAPGRCSTSQNQANCNLGGDSGTEPYIVAHHFLLAHASAVKLYRTKFQASQKGEIGIALASNWIAPFSDSQLDYEAAERGRDFMYGWFLEPLVRGKYPQSMRRLVGRRLPKFSPHQRRLIIGSFDFIGLNFYTTNYAVYAPQFLNAPHSCITDSLAQLTFRPKDDRPIAPNGLNGYPTGIRDLLLYVNSKYNSPVIYITETGMDDYQDANVPVDQILADTSRIDYLQNNLYYLNTAISSGYKNQYGLVFVDYKNELQRYPKQSAQWYKNFLRTNDDRPAHDTI
ncbi:cyanogenic beta-glucosidase-like [Senna tora]|uniref:Cyanogenic beta-glucosidase-like n=1 Tax=Senna tora TaxID=362788 RepID=A0A834SQJ5_9FABA|nr:cyanogenic beta-glucosidase-like [Senna tora]